MTSSLECLLIVVFGENRENNLPRYLNKFIEFLSYKLMFILHDIDIDSMYRYVPILHK